MVVIFSSDGISCAGLGNRCGFPEASIGSLESVFVILSGDGIGWAGLGNRCGSVPAIISSFVGVIVISSSDGSCWAGLSLDSDSRSCCDEASDGKLHVVFVLIY